MGHLTRAPSKRQFLQSKHMNIIVTFEWGCDPKIPLRRYESSYLLNFDQRGQQPLDKGAPVQCYLWDGAPNADTSLFESSFLIYEYDIIKSLKGSKLKSRILTQRFPRKTSSSFVKQISPKTRKCAFRLNCL